MRTRVITIAFAWALSASLAAAESYPDPLLTAVAIKESVAKAKEIEPAIFASRLISGTIRKSAWSAWLPAPKGNFNLFLRFYQPKEKMLNGSYELPKLIKVK